MSLRRYARAPILKSGLQYGTSNASRVIREALTGGTLQAQIYTLQEGERLDTVAGQFYGDGRLWWVIAAASNVGWGLQVPPGTRLLIPDIVRVTELIG